MAKFSLETVKRIYDDKSGDYWEIGPDMDAGELLEIRAYTSSGASVTNHGGSFDTEDQALDFAEACARDNSGFHYYVVKALTDSFVPPLTRKLA